MTLLPPREPTKHVAAVVQPTTPPDPKKHMPDKNAPSVDFSTFVLSLASSAMLHLGKVPDPTGQNQVPTLELARQSIDMLSMLRAKTRGNLTDEESALLDRVLHDARVAYVEESRNQTS